MATINFFESGKRDSNPRCFRIAFSYLIGSRVLACQYNKKHL